MTPRDIPRRLVLSPPVRVSLLATIAALAALVPAVAIALGHSPGPGAGEGRVGALTLSSPAPLPSRMPITTPPPVAPLPSLTPGGAVSGPVTFYGRGYGHGVGLSQYGAQGRALAGQSGEAILAHYYAGTTLGTVSPTTAVRVLVLSAFAPTASVPLVLHGRTGTWSVDGIAGTWPADAKLTIAPTTVSGIATWRVVVTSSTGTALVSTTTCCSIRLRPEQSSTRIQVDSKPTLYDTYRGVVRIYGSATKVNAVNEVGLDLYLRGVVPSEMPYTWPSQALRAQSIAARSYAVNHRHPSTGSYDFRDDTSAQVYHGVKGEKAATSSIVDRDPGVVLRYGTAVANAMFHSAGGGATENNEDAFPSSSGTLVASPVAYLRGSSDRMPDGTPYDAASPYATWHTATYSVVQLSSYFAEDSRTNVGTLTRIDLSHRGVSGRLYRVTLTGSLGTKSVSGDVFRAVFNAWSPAADPPLRSNLFDLQPIG